MKRKSSPSSSGSGRDKRAKPRSVFESLNLELTGARPGDVLVGIRDNNAGCVLIVTGDSAIVPPRYV